MSTSSNASSVKYAVIVPSFESNGIINAQAFFIPDVTIGCQPPYVKGKRDSCWVKYRKGKKPNEFSKTDCEKAIGMSLQPYKID